MTSTINPTAAIHELVDVLTEQRNEAQRQALMHEDRAEADRLLALVRRVATTDQARLTHGIMLVPGEQYAKLRDAHDNRQVVWSISAADADPVKVAQSFVASMNQDDAAHRARDGAALLALIDAIKETGGSVEIHGVKIQRCDERGRTY